MRTKALAHKVSILNRINTKVLFFILAAILLTIFGFYAYLINKTVMNVVAREGLEQRIATLSTEIGELEFEHITAQNKITLELAYTKGFYDTLPTHFIARGGSTILSYNTR